jgi:PPP family 3-phenylpropionic acid transporter
LFASGCLLYAIAFGTWIVLADPLMIVVSRVLSGLAYGSLTVALVLTVGALLPVRLQATGQALYGMSASGIASIVGNLGGGVLFGAYGHGPVFAAGLVGALAAALVAWRHFPARGHVRVDWARR